MARQLFSEGSAGMRRRLVFGALLLNGVPLRGDDLAGRSPAVVRIAPGTPVGAKPPATWSHLVLKSLPRLASGDLDTLPSTAARTATLFRTVILADVASSPHRPGSYVLGRIGIGLSAPDRRGLDVVIAPGRTAEVGIDLGLTDRMVLDLAEEQLSRGKLTAATSTFALYRGPAAMLAGSAHRDVEVCYAFLVDPERGGLRTFVWARDMEETDGPAPGRVVELPPNLVYDCRLDVKAKRLLGALPVSWSFAMTGLPPGRARDATREMARFLAAAGRTPAEPVGLERALRRAASDGAKVTAPPSNAPSEGRAAAAGSDPERSARTSTSGSGRPGTRHLVR
jgi:hypothetical protein